MAACRNPETPSAVQKRMSLNPEMTMFSIVVIVEQHCVQLVVYVKYK